MHTLHLGDCLATLPTLDPDSIDACVTDPPYGLAFMGKEWDHGVPGEHFWQEVMRVLKPGAHLLAFGGTRTFHRLTCAIEDAGFEVRDCLMWIFGSGFPKSHNLKGDWAGFGTALKPAYEPIILARKPLTGTVAANVERYGTGALNIDGGRVGFASDEDMDAAAAAMRASADQNAGRTAYGQFNNGQGSIAPYLNNIGKGRWPANCLIDSTVAADLGDPGRFFFKGDYTWEDDASLCASCAERVEQSARRGTPATRESTATNPVAPTSSAKDATNQPGTSRPDIGCCDGMKAATTATSSSIAAYGRTPTDPSPPDSSCITSTATRPTTGSTTCASCGTPITSPCTSPGTPTMASGEPNTPGGDGLHEPQSRYFYCPKSSRSERNAGLEGMPLRFAPTMGNGIGGKEHDPDTATPKANIHPTVKPLALMRYLCRLVTPPGGVVLDPFMGSGSTGCAAVADGFGFVGIEREAEYIEIARRRIEHHEAQQLRLV